MPTVVEIPDVGPIEFPDEMDDAAIGKAIREDVYKLPSLPDMPEYDERTYRERRFLAESNLRMADEDLARLEAGTAQVQDEAMKAQAAQVLNFARTRRDMAVQDFESVAKDPAPFGKSAQAALASGALNTAAAGADVVESFAPPTGEPARPEDSNRYSKLAGEKERLLADFNKPGPDGVLSEAVMRPRMQRLEEINRELEGIERPRSESLSGQLAGAAAQAFENANINPAATNAAAQIGRGVGTFASMAPTVFMGSVGLPAAVLQMGGETYQRGYTQKEQELRASGMADEAQIADEASKFATTEAIKAAPAFAAYLVGGKLASHLVAKALPAASPLQKTLAGTVAGTGANVLVGGAVRAAHGEKFIPNAEQLTQDVLWGVVHGAGEGRRAAGERKLSREEPTIEQPNAEQISETSAPDGGVRPRSELQEMPASEGGEGIQPSRPGERLAEGPRVETPEAVSEPLRQLGTEGGEAAIVSDGATSIKNAQTDVERANRGLPPVVEPVRRAYGEVWDTAMKELDANPRIADQLVSELREKPRALTDREDAILLHRQIEIQNAYDKAAQDVNTAAEAKDATALAEAEKRLRFASDAALDIYDVDKKAGTETARGLAARKMLARADFTLAQMVTRKRAAKGGEQLTPKEQAATEKQHAEIERTQRELDTRIEQLETQESSKGVEAALKELSSADPVPVEPAVKSLADRIITRLDTAAEGARKRLREKFGQLGSGPDPTIVADLAIYGASKLAKGLLKFGQWSTAMVKEFGEGVRPYLQSAWEASSKHLDTVVDGTPKRVREMVRKEDAGREGIEAVIAERAKAGETAAQLRPYVRKLMESFWKSGVRDREQMVDAVEGSLREAYPEITRRGAMDAMSGYGDFKPLNKEQMQTEIRDIRGQLQQIAKLEDIQKRQPPLKTGVERREPSNEERRLIQQVNEAKKKYGVVTTDPERQLQSSIDARKTYYRNRMADLQAEIDTRQRVVKERTAPPTDAALDKLKAEYEQVRADHDAIFGKREITDVQRLQQYKGALLRRTKDLQKRIQAGDFGKRERRELDLSRDPEAIRLKAENERVKREFERERLRFERARRTLPQKAVALVKEAFNLPRTFLSSFDVSAVLRQGGFITYGNPVRAARAVGTMLKVLVSQRAAERTEQQILARPNAPLYQRAKLYIAPLDDAKLSRQEESIMSELANRIPGIRASNRAYVTFLNKMRADTFDAMKATLEKKGVPLSQAELEAIANYINVATGRGNLGKAAPAAETLATFFFSPRLLVSRFQLLLGQPFKGGSARTRKAVATEYAKLLLGLSAVYALGTMAGADVEADPRSSDFGKLRFGDTRVDPLMGLAQATVLLSRVGSGEAKGPSGKVVDIRGDKKPFGTGGTAEVIGRFLRTKLSPVLGSAVDIAAGSNVIGEEVTPGSAATGLLVPLSFRDIATVMDEQGVPRGTALEILNLFGMGLQHFEDRKR